MNKVIAKNVTLSKPVIDAVLSQVNRGRYKDFSAAINDAAFHYFIGSQDIFDDYRVTKAEVKRSAKKDIAEFHALKKGGKLKAFVPEP